MFILFLITTGINLAGVKWVIRLQLVLLFTIVVAAVDFLIGSFLPHNAGMYMYYSSFLCLASY